MNNPLITVAQHYTIRHLDRDDGKPSDPELGMRNLKALFPDPYKNVNSENFVWFSTSGVHGCYTTIEDIEESLKKYGDEDPDGEPSDWFPPILTTTCVFPRLVSLQYGVVRVRLEDIHYLKSLREASRKAMCTIGY